MCVMSSVVVRHVVAVCSELVHKLLEPLPYVFYWSHKVFYNEAGKLLLADGVHVNRLGQYRLYHTLLKLGFQFKERIIVPITGDYLF